MPEINKKRAQEMQDYMERSSPLEESLDNIRRQGLFKQIKAAFKEPVPYVKPTIENINERNSEYKPPNVEPQTFVPRDQKPINSNIDTSGQRQRADEILNRMRGQLPQTQEPPSIPSDVQALMNQRDDLADFGDMSDPNTKAKFDRLNEMLRLYKQNPR